MAIDTFGADHSLHSPGLCILGRLATSLASTHGVPVAPPTPTHDDCKCFQTLPHVPCCSHSDDQGAFSLCNEGSDTEAAMRCLQVTWLSSHFLQSHPFGPHVFSSPSQHQIPPLGEVGGPPLHVAIVFILHVSRGS